MRQGPIVDIPDRERETYDRVPSIDRWWMILILHNTSTFEGSKPHHLALAFKLLQQQQQFGTEQIQTM